MSADIRTRSNPQAGGRLTANSPTRHSILDFLQWPGMICSLVGAYLLGSQRAHVRIAGFLVFCVSNVLWIAWGQAQSAWALIVLQVGLFCFNLRGIRQNEAIIEEQHPRLEARGLFGKLTARFAARHRRLMGTEE